MQATGRAPRAQRRSTGRPMLAVMLALAGATLLTLLDSTLTGAAAPSLLRVQGARRTTCGSGYGWGGSQGQPCPEPRWSPRWALNLSTAVSNIVNTPEEGSAWGLVTYPWNLNMSYWQDVHPHPGEAAMTRQCELVKALGTGTRCMVYRQNELSLQWQETSRAAQTTANARMYLQFKTKALCEAAAPCDVAAFHQMSQAGKALVKCNRSAPVSAPNCAYCCNFSGARGTGVYNEPIGGEWPSGLKPAAGHNALGDGQLFFDFRNSSTVDFWVHTLALGAVTSEAVDGLFVDDPAGYGQEHPQIQTAVQLSQAEIVALQAGTQAAYSRALELFIPRGKYYWNAFRGVPAGPSATDAAACVSWMRVQCGRPPNESAVMYPPPSATNLSEAVLSIAAFLVTRGAHSYLAADVMTIQARNRSDPFYRMFQLPVGEPVEACVQTGATAFKRDWTGGTAAVDCSTAPRGILKFNKTEVSSSSSSSGPTDRDYHRGPWNRHPRCAAAVTLDAVGSQRAPGSEYAWFNNTHSVQECAQVCCSDWSCWGFAFYPKGKTGNNSAMWPKITLQKRPVRQVIDCANASQARGFECRGDNLSPLGNSCNDPTKPCCALLFDFEDAVVPATVPGVRSGIRGKLPARDPPLGTLKSTVIKNVSFGKMLYIGGRSVYPRDHASGNWDLGDEFPTTWADDGFQYAGAGDNSASGYPGSDSPLTMWRINGRDPRTATFALVGNHTPVSIKGLCPITKSGVPNLKSQSVLAIGNTLYWAVACFDYVDPDLGSVMHQPGVDPSRAFDGDVMHWKGLDGTFNRQRYGVNDTSFIMASTDSGNTWDVGKGAPGETPHTGPHSFFRGRLASPRLINAGQGYGNATDPTHIFALFPGTTNDRAYFAQNDAIWLGRVPTASILDRSAWQFFSGMSGGQPTWTKDDQIAQPVFSHPLMTATQQITYHPVLRIYLMPVWSWCDPDGNPREQLNSPSTGGAGWGYNVTQGKDLHDRSQLTIWEASEPWGPWKLAYRTDDWRGPDGSSGGCA
jgi:hypothetical protein